MSQDRITGVISKKETVTDSDSIVLIANDDRSYMLIQNTSENNFVYLDFDKAATVANSLLIAPGASYIIDDDCPPYDIHCICDTGLSADVRIAEFSSKFWN